MRHVDNSGTTPPELLGFLDRIRSACRNLLDEREKVSQLKDAEWSCAREYLMKLSHHKCWYSEKRVDPDFPDRFAVSHHIPVHDPESTTAYFEHAFEAKNLRFVFRQCDSRRRNFQGYTQVHLRPGSQVATSVDDIAIEEPILLDPTNERDPELLAFRDDGSVVPAVPAIPDDQVWKHKRARYTIDAIGLDLEHLLQERLRVFVNASNASHDVIETLYLKKLSERNKIFEAEKAKNKLVEMCVPQAAYSSVAITAATKVFSNPPDYLDYQAEEWTMPQWWARELVALG